MHYHRTLHPTALATALAAAVLIPVLSACGRRGNDTAKAQGISDTATATPRLVVVPPVSVPYRVVSVTSPGSISGTVLFSGVPKGDTVVQIPADQNGCGKPLSVVRLARTASGGVSGAVVWLTDIREGRGLPFDRRYTITNSECAWDPVVLPTATGSALNVVNDDPLVETAYITDIATGDTVAEAPFTDDGQIIPYDKVTRTPGVYELSIESRPASRAWVIALDHPYVAVTGNDGRFSIDGIPAGTYKVRAWHPVLGIANGTVTVAANGSATTELRF